MKKIYTGIIATGSYLPTEVMTNTDFADKTFYNADHSKNNKETAEILKKLTEISGITERRYAKDEYNTSDLAYFAAADALKSSGIDGESLDYIIVAHNFADVRSDNHYSDMLPNIAAKVKQKLGIMNSDCVAYDILFGCPSWLQAVIQADYFIRSGDAKRILVVGADVMSRVLDPHDLDSMLFGDGAGAVILEAVESDSPVGIICHKTVSDSVEKADYLKMGHSHNEEDNERIYVKMQGRSVFKYAMEKVPTAMDACLKKSGIPLTEVHKILMHQANEKMIRQLIKKLYELNGLDNMPEEVFPLTVQHWGNSSAATLPMLLDWIMKGRLEGHDIKKGDNIILSSVGGGMHANCVIYKHI
jgi:3-oxoacyl-[acyl-carrier-protein] synthase III